ncbi:MULTISPECIES: hypothetical protein [Paenarthrobacter]|uniref:Transposase n=1 Tax=Paenarthrobacter ureafaciens TaxID=37931 RepID=A0AAX3EFS5_PAEUR|nr:MULTISPECIES: hypothetical protein [Paenarthrobacter]MDO5865997.1 hypothetical protein [Paenarthrobacter sp. SD-2]MDO5877092.1 hypothetical protein [Paenarthrobacter sp. SD-1]UYV92294.1 hypothetical protein NL395_17495 [Paenarthrobacter ureafaciens]UYV96829.1 hypothetical protein NL394_17525 [Paenarthrobacter ureafaciens]
MKPAHLIEEIEWQFAQGQSSHTAMTVAGYKHEQTLARWLRRHNRPHLAIRFEENN